MRSNDEIKSIIKQAFAPLECVIEIQDYQSKVGVAVYPPESERLIPFHHEPLNKLRNGEKLFQLLRDARRRLIHLGNELNPWEHDEP